MSKLNGHVSLAHTQIVHELIVLLIVLGDSGKITITIFSMSTITIVITIIITIVNPRTSYSTSALEWEKFQIIRCYHKRALKTTSSHCWLSLCQLRLLMKLHSCNFFCLHVMIHYMLPLLCVVYGDQSDHVSDSKQCLIIIAIAMNAISWSRYNYYQYYHPTLSLLCT